MQVRSSILQVYEFVPKRSSKGVIKTSPRGLWRLESPFFMYFHSCYPWKKSSVRQEFAAPSSRVFTKHSCKPFFMYHLPCCRYCLNAAHFCYRPTNLWTFSKVKLHFCLWINHLVQIQACSFLVLSECHFVIINYYNSMRKSYSIRLLSASHVIAAFESQRNFQRPSATHAVIWVMAEV